MAKKKAKKKVGHTRAVEDGKTKIEDIEEEVTEESAGEEVPAEPAHVPDDIVTIRGRGCGGVTRMPRSEFLKSKFAGQPAAESDDDE